MDAIERACLTGEAVSLVTRNHPVQPASEKWVKSIPSWHQRRSATRLSQTPGGADCTLRRIKPPQRLP